MRIVVIEPGNAGSAIAAVLKRMGHQVVLWSQEPPKLAALRGAGGVTLHGQFGDGFVPLESVTDDIALALEGSELAIIAVPGMVQERLIDVVIPQLRDGQALWFCPGNGASLIAAARLASARPAADVLLIETSTLPLAARRTDDTTVMVRARFRPALAAFPARNNGQALGLISSLFPMSQASHVLEALLLNPNAIIHPLPALMNWGWIESRDKAFSLYGEGMSPGVLRCMEALDRERQAVLTTIGCEATPLDDIYDRLEAPPLYRIGMSIGKAERYEDRFVTEDVPIGLVTVASLGHGYGAETPLTDAVVALSSVLYGIDFASTGRTVRALGLEGMSLAELTAWLRDGPTIPRLEAEVSR